jgi:tetratricopeptide (TPR) repeat protein
MKKYFLALFITLGFLNLSAQQAEDTLSVQELIKKGIEHHDARDYKDAIEAYNEALKIDSTSISATYELALSYLAMRDYKNASAYSTKVINSKEKELLIGAYGVKSESLVETGKVDEAITLLEKALRELGNNYYLHFNLALNYYKKGDLDMTITHVDNALNLNKSQSGAYLLAAYALNDKEIWVQSILSFQIFLLMEPDSHRSKNAFEEMLQVMHVKKTTEEPVERSFIQKQLERHSKKDTSTTTTKVTPPLDVYQDVNRELVYNAIESTLDSLNTSIEQDSIANDSTSTLLYNSFKEVTRNIFTVLSEENDGTKKGFIWSFHVPVITKILNSPYFDTYCRYISVAYFPESLEWWENNQESAAKFVRWFEKGDEDE